MGNEKTTRKQQPKNRATMIEKTIGGDRLGSGKKMKAAMHNYERSTHNLSREWRSSMAAGTLVPCFVEPALNGDKFTIDINTLVKTKPTIAPLFGSFKLQIDIFTIPIRLYNGVLHNNALNIGMNMKKVILPTITVAGATSPNGMIKQSGSTLSDYVGVRGIGRSTRSGQINRKFLAIPYLAYYDIFKNYYANKQETNAYVISPQQGEITVNPETQYFESSVGIYSTATYVVDSVKDIYPSGIYGTISTPPYQATLVQKGKQYTLYGNNLKPENVYLRTNANSSYVASIAELEQTQDIIIKNTTINTIVFEQGISSTKEIWLCRKTAVIEYETTGMDTTKPTLLPFELENIDKMRTKILKQTELGIGLVIGPNDTIPYNTQSMSDENGNIANQTPMNGLVVKTFQSDIFNNWLSSEWITGTNGISEISAVDTSSGSFTMDSLNLAQKVYNMLNRIAISGGTYEDWQEAVFGSDAIRRAESPIYEGGFSAEIYFGEVVSTAETQTAEGGSQPLGYLGGKGMQGREKGGKVEIEIKEPSFIMGIASITPRIDYCQGNKWFMSELITMDDLHKPELDAIGFQDLIEEQMHYDTTTIAANGTLIKKSAGKIPAWLNYMTSYNEVYGEFVSEEKGTQASAMVLTRDYEIKNGVIQDLTTYINPQKFNYAFADVNLTAQNFWVQIAFDVIARRKMSAKIIPNL